MKQIFQKKKKIKKVKATKKNLKKTASSPGQDLHPDWDRFRGTMLYPLSCVTNGLYTARNKWAKILRNKCFDSKMLDLMMLKLSGISMHVLNLIAEEKGKLANKWKTTFCSVMKGNMGIQKHSKLFVSLV